METKFQTSFIPKKPLTSQETNLHAPASTSILMFIAVIIFVGTLVWATASYLGIGFYKKIQDQYRADLDANQKRFNTPLIQDLSRAKEKIDMAKQLLNNHVAVSEAFTIVAALTADKVKFTEFSFEAPGARAAAGNEGGEASKTYRIRMKGLADSFNSIAFQSDVFGKSAKYGTNKVLKNPILSDLAVDTEGNVGFNFSAEIAMPDISYEKVLTATLRAEGTLPPSTQ